MSRTILAIATMDTKGQELAFVADCLRAALTGTGIQVVTIDVGTGLPPVVRPDVPRETVASHHPQGIRHVLSQTDRGLAVTAMGEALAEYVRSEQAAGRVHGIIGLGGSGGSALLAPALCALPVGVPKLLVSTMASGNIAPYVGTCDVTVMPSVVDVSGLNSVSRPVLANAAHALAGMVAHARPLQSTRPAVGLTMFGVTTTCVQAVRQTLEAKGFDPLVFHATGTGGRAMEKLVHSDLITGVLDITTTEVADEVVGGILPAGPERFEVILQKKVPYVLSLGALDMVNFGPRNTVPEKFQGRLLHVHNAHVTLMRTTPEENVAFARWIAGKLNRSSTPLTILVPEKGVSALDAPGQPFYNPQADEALFRELERTLEQTAERRIVRLPLHINDPAFAHALTEEFLRLCWRKENHGSGEAQGGAS